MNLFKTWYSILNAINNSNVNNPFNNTICDSNYKFFNSDTCHLHTVGITKEQLNQTIFNDVFNTTPTANSYVARNSQCENQFYVFGIDKFEQIFPKLKSMCLISTYAATVLATALKHPCRTMDIGAAQFLMVPPYTATECSWPAYGNEQCNGQTNVFRKGIMCSDHDFMESLEQLRQYYPEKPILIVQHSYELETDMPISAKKDTGLIFARTQALAPGTYRKGIDISMPLAAFPHCAGTPAVAYDEPLQNKSYFVSFRGRMYPEIRRIVRDKFHDGHRCVIEDGNDFGHSFEALLHHSRFNLILRGDNEYSYGFDDAVCSGGVPVLITRSWIPPFDEFMPFESYGVKIKEDEIDTLLVVLEALTDKEVQAKRAKAHVVCKHYFVRTKTQVQALLNELLAHPRVISGDFKPSSPTGKVNMTDEGAPQGSQGGTENGKEEPQEEWGEVKSRKFTVVNETDDEGTLRPSKGGKEEGKTNDIPTGEVKIKPMEVKNKPKLPRGKKKNGKKEVDEAKSGGSTGLNETDEDMPRGRQKRKDNGNSHDDMNKNETKKKKRERHAGRLRPTPGR